MSSPASLHDASIVGVFDQGLHHDSLRLRDTPVPLDPEVLAFLVAKRAELRLLAEKQIRPMLRSATSARLSFNRGPAHVG
jgi:hypothetical protein